MVEGLSDPKLGVEGTTKPGRGLSALEDGAGTGASTGEERMASAGISVEVGFTTGGSWGIIRRGPPGGVAIMGGDPGELGAGPPTSEDLVPVEWAVSVERALQRTMQALDETEVITEDEDVGLGNGGGRDGLPKGCSFRSGWRLVGAVQGATDDARLVGGGDGPGAARREEMLGGVETRSINGEDMSRGGRRTAQVGHEPGVGVETVLCGRVTLDQGEQQALFWECAEGSAPWALGAMESEMRTAGNGGLASKVALGSLRWTVRASGAAARRTRLRCPSVVRVWAWWAVK